MKTPVALLFSKLHSLDTSFAAKPLRSSVDTCLNNVVTYLNALKSKHCPRSTSNEYLVSVVFQRPRRLATESETAAYCRSHLTVAAAQFDILASRMKGDRSAIPASQLRMYQSTISDYLHDLRPIVEYLERRQTPDYEFFRGVKNYHPMGIQLFRASCQLADTTTHSLVRMDHNVSQIAAIVMLRQSIEIKLFRVVGVSIFDKNFQSPKLRHGYHFDFIKANPCFFKFVSADLRQIDRVYGWCNVIVHRASQPLAWQLPVAIRIAEGLFESGPLSPDGVWSINGGVQVLDKYAMQAAFAEHFSRDYDHGIWCIQSGDIEAVVSHAA